MAKKVKQTAPQIFRSQATDEEWYRLVEDHEKLSPEEFKKKYGFTWSAVMNDAVERGLYTKRVRSNTFNKESGNCSSEDFIVKDIPKGTKKKQRSIELYEDIEIRLTKLREDKCQYTFASILNQLLDDALKKYGY